MQGPGPGVDQEDDVPKYAYACTECDHRFEVQQSFTDDALTQCPQCQGRLRKLFNTVGIVFKGSGFYRTDSRSNGKRGGQDGSADSGSGATTAAGSSESKGSTGSGSKESGSSDSGGSTGSSGAKGASAASGGSGSSSGSAGGSTSTASASSAA